MAWSSGQKYLAEFLGTFGLLVSVTGAALLTLRSPPSTDFYGRVLLISLSVGLGLLGMIYAFGDVSGGHFNPAVTVGMWIAGRIRAVDAAGYVLAQAAGGVVGVAAVAGVAYGWASLWGAVIPTALASQGYSGNGSPYGAALLSVFLLEVVLTFLLVVVVLTSTRSDSSAKNLAPLGIALTLVMTNLVGIPIDGASINPARSFAPAVLSAWFPGDRWAIQQDWLFWVAPVVGGAIAALVERAMRPKA
jgi:aquaporin Z